MIGTLGLLVAAKRRGEIEAVRPLIDALVRAGLRLGPQITEGALSAAGELEPER